MTKRSLSKKAIRSNIINFFSTIPNDSKTVSITWYNNAHNFCLATSVRFNLDLKVVAAVLALLSPRNKWENNKKDCLSLIQGFQDSLPLQDITVHTFNRNKLKAWKVLSTQKIELGGLKVNSFYNNIINPQCDKEVTIDVWATRVALKDNKYNKSLTKNQYATIQEGYCEAFKTLKKDYKYLRTTSQLQAICWTHIRNA